MEELVKKEGEMEKLKEVRRGIRRRMKESKEFQESSRKGLKNESMENNREKKREIENGKKKETKEKSITRGKRVNKKGMTKRRKLINEKREGT